MKNQTEKGNLQETLKEQLKPEIIRPSIIFLIIGFLLLLISYLVRPHSSQDDAFLSNALSQTAFVVLTVTIVNFLWTLLGGDPLSNKLHSLGNSIQSFDDNMQRYINLLSDSRTTGVTRLLAVSGDFGTQGAWIRRLVAAEKHIDLMGYTLYVWTKGEKFEEEVFKLVQGGVKVRILIMDEKNTLLESFINVEQISGLSTDYVRAEIVQVQKVFEDIGKKIQNMTSTNILGSFEVRKIRKGVVACQICRIDAEMAVVDYLYSEVASRSPLLLIQGNELKMFQAYQKEFDSLWELNRPALQKSYSSP